MSAQLDARHSHPPVAPSSRPLRLLRRQETPVTIAVRWTAVGFVPVPPTSATVCDDTAYDPFKTVT